MRLLVFALIVLTLPSVFAASDVNVTGAVDAAQFYEGGSSTLSNSITGSAGSISCTDCLSTDEIADVYLLSTGDTATGNYSFDSGLLFVDSTNDWVGIGTTSPEQILHIVDDTGFGVYYDRYSGNAAGPNFYLRKGRGSSSSPSAANAGDNAFNLNGQLWNGSDWINVGTINMQSQTLTNGEHSGEMHFLLNDGTGTQATRMLIDETGQIGIGTTAPNNLLHLEGSSASIGINDTDNTAALRGYGHQAVSDQGVFSINGFWNGTVIGRIRFHSGNDTINHDDGDIIFETYEGGVGLEKMRVTQEGFVGIGATDPEGLLHVSGAVNDRVVLDNGILLSAKNSSGAIVNLLSHYSDDVVYLDNPDGDISLRTGSPLASAMYINGSSGNVGIGTTSPAALLHVNGTVAIQDSDGSSGDLNVGGNQLTLQDGTYGGGNGDPAIRFEYSSGAAAETFKLDKGASGYGDGSTFILTDSLAIEGAEGDLFVNGSVGIGTSSPTGILAVNSTSGSYPVAIFSNDNSSSSQFPLEIVSTNTGSSNSAYGLIKSTRRVGLEGYANALRFEMNDDGGTARTYGVVGAQIEKNTTGAVNGTLAFFTANQGTLTQQMTILASGYVGIGTASPAFPLTVGDGSTSINIFGSGTSTALLLQDSDAGTDQKVVQLLDNAGLFKIRGLNDAMSAETVSGITLNLSSGYVGIGDATPGELLDVAGNISLTGQVIPDNLCGITGTVFAAGSSSSLSSVTKGGLQFSWGEGGSSHGPAQPCSGEIVALTMTCVSSSAATGRVQVAVDGTAQGTGCEVSSPNSNNGKSTDSSCSVSFSANSGITPITTTTDASTSACIVSMFVRYD